MRLFCGIEIPSGVKAGLGALTDRLRPLTRLHGLETLAWSPTENLHVTTKFIGEWPEARVDQITGALTRVPPSGPVEIAIRGLGWFPNHPNLRVRNPRVLFAEVHAGPELGTLARETERCLAAVGVPVEEREFRPHLTLARVREGARRQPGPVEAVKNELARIPSVDFGSFRAGSFSLYLSRSGQYTKLQEFTLF